VRTRTDLPFVCPECKVGTPSPHVSFDVAADSFEAQEAQQEEQQLSFDVSNVSFGSVHDHATDGIEVVDDGGVEDSLPADDEDVMDVVTLTVTLVPGGSSRGRDKLVDNLGYAYTVKKTYVLTSFFTSLHLCFYVVYTCICSLLYRFTFTFYFSQALDCI